MISCEDCVGIPASGIWRIEWATGCDAKHLCSACGMYAYAAKRAFFVPTMRVTLHRSLSTKFQQAHTPPANVPEKHWTEHKLPIEATGQHGKTLTQLVVEHKRQKQHSSVAQSILDHYRR